MTRRRTHATTGQLVRSARNLKILAGIDAGISQAEIARHLDLSPAQVSRIRAGLLGNSSSGKKGTPEKILHPPQQPLGPHRPRKR